jgi:hypothetical protein
MRIYKEPLVTTPTWGARFEQWAAVEVSKPGEIRAGLSSHEMEGGLYASFTYVGRADGFADAARLRLGLADELRYSIVPVRTGAGVSIFEGAR